MTLPAPPVVVPDLSVPNCKQPFVVLPPQPTQPPPSNFQGIDDDGEWRRKINQYSSANRPQFPASFHVAAWLIILTLGLYWTIELVTFSRKMYRRANEAAINREEDEYYRKANEKK